MGQPRKLMDGMEAAAKRLPSQPEFLRLDDHHGQSLCPKAGAVCDFCSGRPVMWRYPTTEVRSQLLTELGFLETINEPDWAACDACHTIIAQDDREALLQRSVSLVPFLKGEAPPPEWILREIVGNIHGAFWTSWEALGRPAPLPYQL